MLLSAFDDRLTTVERRLSELEEALKNVKGSPIIAAHVGVRLDLNDDLNAQDVNRRLKTLEDKVKQLS